MPAEFKRVKEIFLAALEAPGREEMLRAACGTDEELRHKVEELLRRHEQAGSFLEPEPVRRNLATEPLGAAETRGSADSGSVAVEKGTDLSGSWIGPYQLLQQLGEGGMGVVYKARHEELDRIVALKMIKAGAHADERDLARFLAEAGAVARLHHPNIVQLYDLGKHQGRPYFTLEYLADGTLAARLREGPLPPREAAWLIEQLARGMHHAHQAGIIHRDLKPANVLLQAEGASKDRIDGKGSKDTAQGRKTSPSFGSSASVGSLAPLVQLVPKIADFGLVKRIEASEGPTVSGAIMGTPQYMAPEQASGDSKRVGPAADVYALGAILYECLTGRPPFRGPTLWETVQQVLNNDPVAPHRLQPRVPQDLETICLKCLHKEPGRRYAAAEALAEDLRRFRAGESIQARPVGRVERAAKLIRRHPTTTALVAVVAASMLAVLGVGAWHLRERALRAEEERDHQTKLAELAASKAKEVELKAKLDLEETKKAERKRALEESLTLELAKLKNQRGELHEQLRTALGTSRLMSDIAGWEMQVAQLRDGWKQAQTLVSANQDVLAAWSEPLRTLGEQIKADEDDWQNANKFDHVLLEAAKLDGKEFNPALAVKSYHRIFQELQLDILHGDLDSIAATIKASPLRYALVAALDHWASWSKGSDLQDRLLKVTRKADPHPLKDQLRDMNVAGHVLALEGIAKQMNLEQESPQTVLLLFWVMKQAGGDALPLLRHALVHHSGDFWLNFELGYFSRDSVEKIGCFRAAAKARPASPFVFTLWAAALTDQKEFADAVICHKKAVALAPQSAHAWHNMGTCLAAKKDYQAAIECYQQAVTLEPRYALAYFNLGYALHQIHDQTGAIAAYEKSIALEDKVAWVHVNLGVVLSEQNKICGAIACFQKAIAVAADKDDNFANYNLASILKEQGALEQAITYYKEAVRRAPHDFKIHLGLGKTLYANKDIAEAIKACQSAVALNAENADAHFYLAMALKDQTNLPAAIDSFKQSIALDPNRSGAHYHLGMVLYGMNDLPGARDCLTKVTELDPKFAAGHYNLGLVLANLHQVPDAIVKFRKAIELDPDFAPAYYNLGVALSAMNDPEAAIDAFKKAIAVDAKYAAAHHNLGAALLAKKDLKGAKSAYQNAIAADPKLVPAYTGLATVLHKQKDLAGAITAYRQAIALDASNIPAHGGLGLALLDQGDFAAAEKATLDALKLLPPGHPMAKMGQNQLMKCQQLLALDQKLTAIGLGQAQPANAHEQLGLGYLCAHYKKRYFSAVKFYGDAFAAAPELAADAKDLPRYHAACAAVLAAAGKGKDAAKLTDGEKTKLRQEALGWLKADLELLERQIKGNPLDRPGVVEILSHWQTNPDLGTVREPKSLEQIAESERKQWTAFWTAAEALHQKAQTGGANP